MRDWMWWIVAPLGFVAVIAGLVLVPLGLILAITALNEWFFHIEGGLSAADARPWAIGIAILGGGFILGQWFMQLRK